MNAKCLIQFYKSRLTLLDESWVEDLGSEPRMASWKDPVLFDDVLIRLRFCELRDMHRRDSAGWDPRNFESLKVSC